VTDGYALDSESPPGFLDTALEIARTIDSLEVRSDIIALIAMKYVESGEVETGLELGESINEPFLRDQALAALAPKCIQAGNAAVAEETAEMIDDDTAYALAAEQMAVAYAELGSIDQAAEVAHRLPESAPVLSRIAQVCLEHGLAPEALKVANAIDYPDLRAPVLLDLAGQAMKDGRETAALELLEEANAGAQEIEFSEPRTATLVAIAALNREWGKETEAFEALVRARQLCEESEDFSKDADLVQIAAGFAELQHYKEATEVTEQIDNQFQFAHATVKIALAHQRAGQTEQARTLLAKALETARTTDAYGELSLVLRESLIEQLSVAYGITGDYDKAVDLAMAISAEDRRDRLLTELAKLCVPTGNNTRVLEIVEKIGDEYARVIAEVEIADTLLALNQAELADHTLFQALADAVSIQRSYQKALILIEIAGRFAKRDQPSKAIEILLDSLQAVALTGDAYEQSQALIAVAGRYRELGLVVGEKEQAILEQMLIKIS
jgi:tetratricopeptide (TPR) repeat protein